jgi:hypothetical protein
LITESERFEKYFRDLEALIPEPPPNWKENAKPCKWDKKLKERQNDNPGS